MWTMVSMDAETRAPGGSDAARAEDRVSELYRRHVPDTLGFAYLLTGDRAEAEDLVHDGFIRAIGRLRHLRSADAFAPI